MNISNTKKQSFLLAAVLLLSGLLGGGCSIREDYTDCPRPFRLFVKAVDIDLQDITESGEVESVFLFVYNELGELMQSVELDIDHIKSRKPIPIDIPYPGFKSLNFIAWGNVGETVSLHSDDLDIVQKSTRDGTTMSPPDLFHGTLDVTLEYGGIENAGDQTIVIGRKTSQIAITSVGLKSWNDNKEGEYTYRLSNSPMGYNRKGVLSTDHLTSYKPKSEMDIKGNLSADIFRTFPTNKDEFYLLEILHNGLPIFAATHGSDGMPFIPEVGRVLNIHLEFNIQTSISVQVVITPWNVVHQFVTIG